MEGEPQLHESTFLSKFFSRAFHFGKILIVCALLVTGIFFGSKALFSYFAPIPPSEPEEIIWGKQGVTDETKKELDFNDSILQTKVEATVASANVHGGRMGSYDGVCSDIIIVAPVACSATTRAYAIFAPMSNGTYFCVDKSGFRGLISARPTTAGACK